MSFDRLLYVSGGPEVSLEGLGLCLTVLSITVLIQYNITGKHQVDFHRKTMSSSIGRVAVVGTGSRGLMFVNGVAERPGAQIVAFCEPNAVRAEYYNAYLESLKQPRAPVYKPEQFAEMLRKEKVETVVITCIDALHDLYIVPALEAGGEQ